MHDLEELVRRVHTTRADFQLRDIFFLFIAWMLACTCRRPHPHPPTPTHLRPPTPPAPHPTPRALTFRADDAPFESCQTQ